MGARWDADREGCIFAGSSTRTADDLNACVILLACDEGWSEHGGARQDAEALFRQDTRTGCYWADDPDVSEYLAEAARDAEEWLNEHIAPTGYSFSFDDGFYLWPESESGEYIDV
jgi:hypothetical protein